MRLARLLKREHRHAFKWRTVLNGPVESAQVAVCPCGQERTQITGAGHQQIGLQMDVYGLTYDAARERVLAGEYVDAWSARAAYRSASGSEPSKTVGSVETETTG